MKTFLLSRFGISVRLFVKVIATFHRNKRGQNTINNWQIYKENTRKMRMPANNLNKSEKKCSVEFKLVVWCNHWQFCDEFQLGSVLTKVPQPLSNWNILFFVLCNIQLALFAECVWIFFQFHHFVHISCDRIIHLKSQATWFKWNLLALLSCALSTRNK